MSQATILGRAARGWTRAASATPMVGVVDVLLRGLGQVMLQNNPATGLVLAAGVLVGDPLLAVAGLVGLGSSTLAAHLLGAEHGLIRDGQFGFNGVLVGIALAANLRPDSLLVLYVIAAGASSTLVLLALGHLLGRYQVPVLTAPFVLVTWAGLLAADRLDHLDPDGPGVPAPSRAGTFEGSFAGSFEALLRGISQVVLQDSWATGLLLLFGVLLSSRISALFAVVGSTVGAATALALGGQDPSVVHGVFGFNAVLSAIAVGGLFFVLTWCSALLAVLAAAGAAALTAGMAAVLAPSGEPALTAPFVLVTWLCVLAGRAVPALRPVALADVITAEQVRRDHRTGGGTPPTPPGSDPPPVTR
ncbi:urea transporter [Aquipuribacter hungaricus]|uniref:Urea transporter n=1 Tax=Aquipuribacter hungaricus TaxID=545624 RepID=A0ABV7WMK5_9MICO